MNRADGLNGVPVQPHVFRRVHVSTPLVVVRNVLVHLLVHAIPPLVSQWLSEDGRNGRNVRLHVEEVTRHEHVPTRLHLEEERGVKALILVRVTRTSVNHPLL